MSGFPDVLQKFWSGELRNVVCRKLIHTCLSHLLFYQCSLCSEHELVIVIFSRSGNFQVGCLELEQGWRWGGGRVEAEEVGGILKVKCSNSPTSWYLRFVLWVINLIILRSWQIYWVHLIHNKNPKTRMWHDLIFYYHWSFIITLNQGWIPWGNSDCVKQASTLA